MSGLDQQTVIAASEDEGVRLDKFLVKMFSDHSRSRLQGLVDAGHVLVNGEQVEKKVKLKAGDRIDLTVPPLEILTMDPVPMDLALLYEDEEFLALNKPAGLVVHPGNGTDGTPTLVHGLLAHCAGGLSGIGGVERPGIVHRLDKETSGVMVVAKTDRAHRALSACFAARETIKVYHALVMGVPALLSGVIRGPIGRHPVHRHKMAVVAETQGREARTDWKRKEVLGDYGALLECRLHTGRTHQIRVHCSHLGHPLLGDSTYGFSSAQFRGPPVPRVMLHSRLLRLPHPVSGEELAFEAPYPDDFKAILAACQHPRG